MAIVDANEFVDLIDALCTLFSEYIDGVDNTDVANAVACTGLNTLERIFEDLAIAINRDDEQMTISVPSIDGIEQYTEQKVRMIYNIMMLSLRRHR